jgi:hypothetical protein
MKLTTQTIDRLKNLLQVCAVANIDKLIIADGKIRGVEETFSIVLLADQDVPDFGTFKVGLNRLNVLRNRLALVQNDLTINAAESKNGSDITHLEISGKNTKVQFRCAQADMMKIPKALNDVPNWFVQIPIDTVKLIKQAVSAMELEDLILTAKPNGEIFFEGIDKNKDTFETKFADKAVWIPDNTPEPNTKVFCYTFPVKCLMSILWFASEGGTKDVPISIGAQGIMTVVVNGMDFYVIRKAV